MREGHYVKVEPPHGVPEKVTFREKQYSFDCVAGTGDIVYQRRNKEGTERFHVLLIRNPEKGTA